MATTVPETGPARGRRAGAHAPLWPAALLAALLGGFVAASLYARLAADAWLGVPLAPFYYFPDLRVAIGWTAAAVLAFAAGVFASPRLVRARMSPPAFAGAALALGLALRLLLAAARSGPEGWYGVFGGRVEAQNEYIPALPALSLGWGPFLDRFAEVAPSLPIHPSAHPPGLLLVFDALGITTAYEMAAFTIVGGALAIPLAYVLARRLLDETRARVATLLFVFAPNVLIYGASSTDAVFVTLGLLAVVGMVGHRRIARALGAAMLAVASFFSFSILAVGAWSALVVGLRDGLTAAVRVAAVAGAALVALYAGLWALSGYDVFGNLEAADFVYRAGPYFARPYLYWLVGSPAAWLVAIGLPLAWYTLRGLAARHPAALALAAIVVVAAIGGYTKSETERIWQFMVPFAAVAAAAVLPRRRLALVLGLLAVQALATELLFDTKW